MSNNEATLANHYVEAFRENLMLAPQQTDARLVNCVDADLAFSTPGDRFNADDMGTSEPEAIEDRFGPSPEGTVDKGRRVGFMSAYDDGKFIDDIDKAMSLSDPSNMTMQAMMAGHERFRDKAILTGLLGTAYSGRDGLTPVAYDTTNQQVAVNDWTYYDQNLTAAPTGNSGLTISKLISTGVKLDAAEMIGEKFCYASAKQIGNLLRDPSVRNIQTAEIKALMNGEIHHFMGFNFIRGELAPLAAGVRSVPAWKKPALCYRARMLTDVQITRRSDRRFNWYAYYKGFHGAVRREDVGVVNILCAES